MPTGPASPRGLAGLALVLGASLAMLALHAAASGALVPLHLRLLSALPGVAALVLWWRYFAEADRTRFPFLAWAVTQLYLYWGLAAVTLRADDEAPPLSDAAWAAAVVGALVVIAALVVGHPAGQALGACLARGFARCLPPSAPRLGAGLLVPWMALAMVVHAGAVTSVVPPELVFLAQTLGDYTPLLAALAWTDVRSGGRAWPLAACTAALGAAGLLTGMMEAVVQPVLTAIVLYVVFRRVIPWRLVAAGALIIVVVNPAKHHYREMAWDPESGAGRSASDPLLAAERWGKALEAAWLGGQVDRAENAAGLASRLDQLRINATVFESTPATIPFDRGRNWPLILGSFVPRALYPGKPDYTDVYNDRFSVTFGFQTWEGTETSTASFPLVADGYWNFGWPGLVIVGVATGLVFGIFTGAFRATSWAVAAIAAAMYAQLHATSHLAAQVIGVVPQVVGLAAVTWVAWGVSVALDAIAGALSRRRPAAVPGEGA